jgi:hypothetical protein
MVMELTQEMQLGAEDVVFRFEGGVQVRGCGGRDGMTLPGILWWPGEQLGLCVKFLVICGASGWRVGLLTHELLPAVG